MKGIPTKYRGVQFRSRLEAKWAAFFDLLGWRYEYEPFDLNGWIPDFALSVAPRKRLLGGSADFPPETFLVEIKPIDRFCRKSAEKILAALPEDFQGGVILCGATIKSHDWHPCSRIGWIYDVPNHNGWRSSRIFRTADNKFDMPIDDWRGALAIGFHSGETLEFNGKPAFGSPWAPCHPSYLDNRWHEAGNRTQWNAPR